MLKIPRNISLMPLPPRAPELNGQESIRQFDETKLALHPAFKCFDDIVDHAVTPGHPDR
jgi:hypothetical protein